ncbi:hypothetical protein D3C83_193010 [compost metagenome]
MNFRQRSADFGTPDQWLSAKAPVPQPNAIADKSVVNPNRFEKAGTKADVIFDGSFSPRLDSRRKIS